MYKQSKTQSKSRTQIVVIGAGYAGLLAANRLSNTPNAQVTLISESDQFVERVRLHQAGAGTGRAFHPVRSLLNRRVQFVQARVAAVQPEQNAVVLADGTRHTYDKLVVTLGSHVDRDSVPGVREFAFALDGGQVDALHTRLAGLRAGGRVVVVGGGLTGIEAATEFAEAYPQVRVVLLTRGKLGEDLSAPGAAHLRRVFARLHIEIVEETNVERVEADGVLAGSNRIPADVVVWAGSFAVPALAHDAGLKTNERGQILVDECLRSLSHPNIYAAGDSAALPYANVPIRMACATAQPMALYVGNSVKADLAGKPLPAYQFGYLIRCISLGRGQALVQRVQPDDTPIPSIITGRVATWIKELICRATVLSIRAERLFPSAYTYPVPKMPARTITLTPQPEAVQAGGQAGR